MAEDEPVYSFKCLVCTGTEIDRFGGVFRCRTCRCEVDPFQVYVEQAATSE